MRRKRNEKNFSCKKVIEKCRECWQKGLKLWRAAKDGCRGCKSKIIEEIRRCTRKGERKAFHGFKKGRNKNTRKAQTRPAGPVQAANGEHRGGDKGPEQKEEGVT